MTEQAIKKFLDNGGVIEKLDYIAPDFIERNAKYGDVHDIMMDIGCIDLTKSFREYGA